MAATTRLGRGRNNLSLAVMFLVLLGAALHATWNTIIKAGSDKLLDTILVTCVAASIASHALNAAYRERC